MTLANPWTAVWLRLTCHSSMPISAAISAERPVTTSVGRPEGWGMEQNSRYTAENYHKPSDEFDPSWDFAGMQEDARLLFRVGLTAAQNTRLPEWKEGTEFKAVRERSLSGAASR